MVWAYTHTTFELRRAMEMKVQGRGGRGEDLSEDGWTKYMMISTIRDCRLMKCTTGGVCHCKSTPHKSGNDIMEKKNICSQAYRMIWP